MRFLALTHPAFSTGPIDIIWATSEGGKQSARFRESKKKRPEPEPAVAASAVGVLFGYNSAEVSAGPIPAPSLHVM